MSDVKGKEAGLGIAQIERFEAFVLPEPNSGCWLWMGSVTGTGHGCFGYGGKGRTVMAHRAAYALYRGAIPIGAMILHKCDVACCVNPDHLYPGTHRDNMRDMRERKRARPPRLFGEAQGGAKLTNDKVRHIRASRENAEVLAASLGVSVWSIYDIRARRSWRHI